MFDDVEKRLTRQELIRLAVQYASGKNANMPAHARRVLLQQFGIDVLPAEVEAECSILAGEALAKLAQGMKP